jgi:D-lactate dehydrogenase
MDVMFYEVFKEEEAALRKYLPKGIKAGFTSKTIQAFAAKEPPAKLISIRTQSVIPTLWAKKLNGILTRSTGFDHLLAYRRETKTKILCGYLGDYCARAVAEQAMLMTVALLRKLKLQVSHFENFDRDHLTGRESGGRRLLVVGVGNIGTEIVDIARGLRMEVKGVDIKRRLRNFKYVSLSSGIAWAEVIVCALPLTQKTKGLLSYSALKKARPGSVFVNVSRGEVSPSQDLARLLKEGILEGVGLDVFSEESILAESLRRGRKPSGNQAKAAWSLKGDPRVIFTPHNAFNTEESVERKAQLSAQAVQRFLAKRKFPFPVI